MSRRRARLLARVERRYEIVDQPFTIGPLRLNFTRVKDADRVLDQVCAEQDAHERKSQERKNGNELHLPYWAELWDSSIGVGHWLVTNRGQMSRRWDDGDKEIERDSHSLTLSPGHLVTLSSSPPHTLDLGCGMGLAGTVAAAMGHRVTLADIESPALLFARLNTLPYASRAYVRKLNWQTDNLGERFDLILGADVLYERAQWEFLEPFWRAHLAERGVVILGEPGRMTGDQFGEWIAARGWTLTQLEQPVVGRARPIRLFVLNR